MQSHHSQSHTFQNRPLATEIGGRSQRKQNSSLNRSVCREQAANSRATLFLRLCTALRMRRRQRWQRCTSVQFSDHLSTYLYIRASFRGRRCNDEPFPNNIAKYEAYFTMFLSPFEFARRFQNPGKAEPAILVYELWIQSSFLMSSAIGT